MTEQELLNQIKESAEQVEIPDSLMPEQIAARLDSTAKTNHIFRFHARKAVSAAAVLLLCGTLSAVAWNNRLTVPDANEFSMETTTGNGSDTNGTAPPPEDAGGQKPSVSGQAETEEEKASPDDPKKDAGTLYTVAKSYDQVYDILENSYDMQSKYRAYAEGIGENGAVSDSAGEDATADADVSFDTSLSYGAAVAESSSAKKAEYSSTNLQTKGVDESDKIKTDGRYIYTVTGAKLKITDTAGGELKLAGFITPDLGASDSILEFYVDGQQLFLLVQHYDTSLTEETSYYYTAEGNTGFIPLTDCGDVSSLRTNASSVLYTYDITDPANPSLIGNAEQDGYYYTSRKIGDIIYLFTQQSLYTGDTNKFIPCVNEEKIPYDHIYVPESGSDGFIISSININDPDTAADKVMLVHNSVNVYVATDAIYLYHTDYQAQDHLTQIAKFSIEDGVINAVNATSVKGGIYDTFAINASQDTLRVLTTYNDRNGSTDNRLSVLDSNLQLIGSLDGIARGEEIYAARYFGNTAYFITYKNIDPLFAVDLTDPSHPALLGELEITGFSDYLHFWGTDKLLGIGYETDPDSGEQKGLKLVMFDISNPTDLKIVDSTVIKDAYYSPALSDYKCVLAEPEKNLIGFAAGFYEPDYDTFSNYLVYSFEDGHFQEILTERLPDYNYISYDSVRGIYIEDTFYIACPTEITAYDMANHFEKSGYIDLTD